MALSDFPNGVTSFGIPQVGGGLPLTPFNGTYWFVDSNSGSAGNPGTFSAPFAALGSAITAAANNDVIFVAPGHAQTVSAAGGIAIASTKTGLRIIGGGQGNARPTFTFATSTAATWTVAGANTLIRNIIGKTSVDQLVSPIVVSAAGCTIDVEWQDGDSTHEAVTCILTTAAADDLNINLKYIGFTAGTHCVTPVKLIGVDNAIVNVDFYGKASTAVVDFATTACTNIEVYGYIYNSGGASAKNVVDTVGGSTWFSDIDDGVAGRTIIGGSGASPGGVGENVAFKAAAAMVNGNTIFTVAGGPIEIIALYSVCAALNDATASTLQYSATPTSGSAQTISGASSSLANAQAGASVALAGTALATAALYNANGPNLSANPGTIIVPAGIITMVIGVGSTTGTWQHYIRYRPLAYGVTVS